MFCEFIFNEVGLAFSSFKLCLSLIAKLRFERHILYESTGINKSIEEG